MICSAPLRLCVRRIEKGLKKNGDTDPLNQYVWHPYFIDALAIRWYDANTSGSPSDFFTATMRPSKGDKSNFCARRQEISPGIRPIRFKIGLIPFSIP